MSKTNSSLVPIQLPPIATSHHQITSYSYPPVSFDLSQDQVGEPEDLLERNRNAAQKTQKVLDEISAEIESRDNPMRQVGVLLLDIVNWFTRISFDQDVFSKKARRAKVEGNKKDAEKYFKLSQDSIDKLIKSAKDPKTRDHYYLLKGKECCEFGRYEKAIEAFNLVSGSYNNDYHIFKGRGEAYQKLGKYKEFLSDAINLANLEPTPDNLYSRAFARFCTKDYKEAERDFSKVISAININNYPHKELLQYAYTGRARSLCNHWKTVDVSDVQLSDYYKAVEAFKKAQKVNSENINLDDINALKNELTNLFYKSAYILHEKGNYDEAIKALDVILDIDPESYGVGLDKGEIYEKMDKNHKAIDEYRQILNHTDHREVHLHLAMVLLKENKEQEAEDHFVKAKMHSEDYLSRAEIYKSMGGHEANKKAIRDYEIYLKDPKHSSDFKTRLTKSVLHFETEEYLEGLGEYLRSSSGSKWMIGGAVVYAALVTVALNKIFNQPPKEPSYSLKEQESSIRNYARNIFDLEIDGDSLSEKFSLVSAPQFSEFIKNIAKIKADEDVLQKVEEILLDVAGDKKDALRDELAGLASIVKYNKAVTIIEVNTANGPSLVEKNFVYDTIIPAGQARSKMDQNKLLWVLNIFVDEFEKHANSVYEEGHKEVNGGLQNPVAEAVKNEVSNIKGKID